ncbi:hypothetical protein IZ6_22870 [Terrihabitans soli]|uniref:Two pore domain potassium channel family protein n=1 Tax=Terrihabitans soli TaxID=708113 RepID=A0A6S6QWC5_9HYPH|nr:hypothetical protein [Terrihabitans soli]BCJ91552.1 hypothetical protein IZ6_22870 [Terrihabitans soli]
MWTQFERRRQKLATPRAFAHRMLLAVGLWLAITAVGLTIGVAGYMIFGGLGLVDAFENAAMILSGMGPVADLSNDAAKIFAGCYAIFSGLIIVIATGFILAPILHRVLHVFHVEGKGDN